MNPDNKNVSDFVEPVEVLSEKNTLKDVREKICYHPIAVKSQGRWCLLIGQFVVGYPETRCLGDLPLMTVPILPPKLPIPEVVRRLASSKSEWGLVVQKGHLLGIVSFRRLLEEVVKEAKSAAELGRLLSDALNYTRILIWQASCAFSLKEQPPLIPYGFKIYGLAEDLVGYSNKELTDNPKLWFDSIHPNDKKAVPDAMTWLEENKTSVVLEYRFRHKNGDWIWLREHLRLVHKPHESKVDLYGIVDDITKEINKREIKNLADEVYRVLSKRFPGEALETLGQRLPIAMGIIWSFLPSQEMLIKIQWVHPRFKNKSDKLSNSWVKNFTILHKKDFIEGLLLNLNIKNGELGYIPDLTKDKTPDLSPLAKYEFRSFLVLPVILEDKKAFLGILGNEVDGLRKWIPLFEELKPTFTAGIKSWLYEEELKRLNVTLEQQVKERTYQLQVLYELAQQFSYTLNYDELFKLIIQYLHKVVNYDVAAWLLVDPAELLIYPTRPLSGEMEKKLPQYIIDIFFALGGKREKWTIRIEQPYNEKSPPIKYLKSTFQVPLNVGPQRKSIGLLFVGAERENAFSENQIKLLHTVTNQASVSIKKLRALLKAQSQQIETIFNTVPQGLILLDAEKRLILINPTARKYLNVLTNIGTGQILESLGGIPLEMILRPPNYGSWHQIELKTPRRRIFEVMATPIKTHSPQPSGWVLVIQETTQQREIQEKADEQARLAAVGQLAAGIAHDFNNLLSPIIGYAELLARKKGLPKDVVNALNIIQNQGKRAAQLIQQILDFSRKSVREKTTLDLIPFLKETIKLLERTIPEDIHIQLSIEPGDYLVKADPIGLQQVVTNLAVNARDAMPEGGEFLIHLSHIEIKPDTPPPLQKMSSGNWVVLRFSDTGTGIKPEILPHIFEPFFTTKERKKGTGLGLSQVYGIVRQHGGVINVESQLNKGTTFTIYLPALPSKKITEESEEKRRQSEKGKGETIFVIEDDETVRQVITAILRNLDYKVIEASHGGEALEIAEKINYQFDLLITDWVMPEMNGLELIKELRKRGYSAKVLIVSGYPLDSNLSDFDDLKIEGWVTKPILFSEFARLIADILQNKPQNNHSILNN